MKLRTAGVRSKCQWDIDIAKSNVAITSHMRNGCCEAALAVFNSMPRRSSVSYNAMISGYLCNNQFNLARRLFNEMPQRDLFSWNLMLGGYLKHKNLGSVRAFFAKMPVKDVVSWNSMLSGYAQNGMVDQAHQVFEAIPEKNNISWNGLLSAYVQSGRMEEAKKLFDSKRDWEISSWNCLMNGLVRKKKLAEAMNVFEKIPRRDNVSWNIIVTGFAQNGEMAEARRLFDRSPVRDVFAWTAMVSGYAQNGMVDEARRFFDQIPNKNIISWNAMITGYMHHNKMDMARALFDSMPLRNGSSWNIMITGYAQSGDTAYARELFEKMPNRDSISWSAMISGYSQSGYSEEALRLLIQYKRIGGSLNRSLYASSISACASIATLELGRQIHSLLTKSGFGSGCFIGNALLAMYFRCGSIEDARQMYDAISEKDTVSWNTMIYGYARHGFGHEALRIFDSMKLHGVPPDGTTMVGVLGACAHAGLVDKGLDHFNEMKEKYSIKATSSHYSCIVDLLGRAGRLKEAREIIRNMPFPADGAVWGALLGASRIHGNTEIGEEAAEKVLEMESESSGMYVLLSNIYADSRRWIDANRIRRRMNEKGVRKEAGHSWIEVRNQIHLFTVGDCVHPEKEKIYKFLEEMDAKMRVVGYVSLTKMVLHDVEDEEKEHLLKHHSEKLAVAFGILSLPMDRPIRVIKNLRVCEDCHNAIKLMAKIVGRLIILRDSNRFHHFKDGFCSCGDYW